MNVLVYNGPGVSKTSLTHTLATLRAILLPNYVVQPITPQSIAKDPWEGNCALFVLPGGRDLPYVTSFEQSSSRIADYVQNGGSFLGLCAGAYYACKRVEWEVGTDQAVTGDRPLRFFDGVGRGCTYPGFQYASEAGARAITLRTFNPLNGQETTYEGLYYNGGGDFVDAHSKPNAQVLATYTEGSGIDKCAGVLCTVGRGRAILWAIHPEYPLTLEPAVSAIAKTKADLQANLVELETRRWDLMRNTLELLGLDLPQRSAENLSPTAQLLFSAEASKASIETTMEQLKEASIQHNSDRFILEDNADTFLVWKATTLSSIDGSKTTEGVSSGPPSKLTRSLIIREPGETSNPQRLTFDVATYYTALRRAQCSRNLDDCRQFKMGDTLLYGEVVTSTQSLLDKNPKLMGILPVPTLSLATHQIAGRGRGSNSWLSPPGCLQFSLLLRLPLSSFPASKVVFIQYLFALAVVESCRSPDVLGAFGDRVRLKWPNDIYAITEREGAKKIGGILVNTSFMGGSVDIVIGCGLNVLSPSPLTSLTQLIPPGLGEATLTMETTTATIMAVFDEMWSRFVSERGSFDSFMDPYLERWLHSDQLVKLTTVDPPIMVRISGITPDHGLLRTIPESRDYRSHRGDEFIDLQPDGNSFDLMSGLIRTKT